MLSLALARGGARDANTVGDGAAGSLASTTRPVVGRFIWLAKELARATVAAHEQ